MPKIRDTNLLEEFSLSFESHKWLDQQFGNVWIFIATDASDGRKMMITGIRKTPHTRLMVSLLGKGGSAFKKIATLLSPFSNHPSRKYVYADYEIFKRCPLIDKPEIDPTSAIFRIHAEWPVQHVKWLSKPPMDTPMTITFSPGWFNSHVGLIQRSEEIEYLLVCLHKFRIALFKRFCFRLFLTGFLEAKLIGLRKNLNLILLMMLQLLFATHQLLMINPMLLMMILHLSFGLFFVNALLSQLYVHALNWF